MNVDISIPQIWQRVGIRRWTEQLRAHSLAANPGPETALVLYWPISNEYLRVEAARMVVDDQGVKQRIRFGNGKDGAVALLTKYGFAAGSIPRSIERGKSNTLFCEIKGDDRLAIDFEVDTNHPDLLKDAKDANGQALVKQIEVQVVTRDEGGATRADAGVIYVHLTPSKGMERYDGYVALDLGNTNSTLVCLDALSRGDAHDVTVVKLGLANDAGPIPSALRIKAYDPPPEPHKMDSAVYSIGEQAREDSQGWLVLGAKRLLADGNVAAKHEILVRSQGDQNQKQKHSVGKELPAELFLCGMFRGFHERQLCVPRRIAITCPATFSDWETRRLREAVVQGWRRSLGADIREYDPKKIRDPELPDIVLDEASAAAFYFLYHDYIDETGGLDVLNYLHGAHGGLNLLVFDCGGGTTDIALIHAAAQYKKSKDEKRLGRLGIDVLGRTGHRSFGGDDITVAAFRALKAKIAKGLGLLKGSPELPDQAADLPAFIERARAQIDAAVPTLYNPDNIGLEENERRKEATDTLWKLAELYKIALGSKQASPVKVESGAQVVLTNYLREVHRGKVDDEKVRSAVYKADLHREEVDVQIKEKLSRSIEYANRMIRAKLPDDEVHAVYIVGNASCYPLIGEMLRRDLQVPFIERRIKTVAPDDLKNSVAKGAVLAMRMTNQAENLDVDFDRRLCDRLPFDVTFRDRVSGVDRVLFREHGLYQELGERQIPVPNFRGEDERRFRELSLERRWPGDDKPQPYIRFQFPEVIQGPVKVWYDNDKHKFVMHDENGSSSDVVGEDLDRAVYRAPVQSGTL